MTSICEGSERHVLRQPGSREKPQGTGQNLSFIFSGDLFLPIAYSPYFFQFPILFMFWSINLINPSDPSMDQCMDDDRAFTIQPTFKASPWNIFAWVTKSHFSLINITKQMSKYPLGHDLFFLYCTNGSLMDEPYILMLRYMSRNVLKGMFLKSLLLCWSWLYRVWKNCSGLLQ